MARPVVVLVQHPLQPVVPSHAIEMTSALLERRVASAVERYRVAAATPERQQDLAAVIRLCGAGAGDAYAARGFRPAAGQRCGDHDVGPRRGIGPARAADARPEIGENLLPDPDRERSDGDHDRLSRAQTSETSRPLARSSTTRIS